jgi:hypothetical protein
VFPPPCWPTSSASPAQPVHPPEEPGYEVATISHSLENECLNLDFNFGNAPGNYPGNVFWAGLTSAVQSTVEPRNTVLGDAAQNIDFYGPMVVGFQMMYPSYESGTSAVLQVPMNSPLAPAALPFTALEEGLDSSSGYVATKSVSPLLTDLKYVSGSRILRSPWWIIDI